ncbi:hypothetical protein Fcan01_11354 [Folsomia candida]|uniref:Gustatory receptor n=1 Tax=Folsomia candida TaxID=158441 RepID=A0A226E950_FOLCA|nr:hypothetical protein Fcan01_11354 [Folsomia candida]
MYSIVFLPILKSHLIPCRLHNCVPFEFDDKSKRFTKSSRNLRTSQFQCFISILYSFAMLAFLLFGQITRTDKFQGAVFFMLSLLASITRWTNIVDNDTIQVINTFLEFEKTAVLLDDGYTFVNSRTMKGMKYFILLMEFSLPLFSILQILLLVFIPCTPPFLMSMSSSCRSSVTPLRLCNIRFVLHLADLWILSNNIFSAAIPILFVLCGGAVSFLAYFNILKGRIKETEISHNLSDCIHLYRSIQLLEKSFNSILMHRVIPPVMMLTAGIQIVGLYVYITHHKDIPTHPGLLIFPLVGIEGIICNVLIFTVASFVYTSSLHVLRSLRKRAGNMRETKSWTASKELKSLTFMSVKFASNFVDGGTPLSIQTFCMNQIASLCLLQVDHRNLN